MKVMVVFWLSFSLLLPLSGLAEDKVKQSAVTSSETSSASAQTDKVTDRNRTRYLVAPSSFMLKEGESYLSQSQLLFSSFSYGITDHFTLSARALLPLWIADFQRGFHILPGAKYGWTLNRDWRVATGVETVVIPQEGTLVFPYAGTTYGTQRRHVTVNLGQPFKFDTSEFEAARFFLVSINGNVWLSEHMRLVTENWVLYFDSVNVDLRTLFSLAMRFQGQQFATDLGLAIMGDGANLSSIPLPWLDFTYNF